VTGPKTITNNKKPHEATVGDQGTKKSLLNVRTQIRGARKRKTSTILVRTTAKHRTKAKVVEPPRHHSPVWGDKPQKKWFTRRKQVYLPEGLEKKKRVPPTSGEVWLKEKR